MGDQKVPPPTYMELKPANFSMEGDAKEHKDELQKAMFDMAKKIFEKNKDLVTLKPPAGKKTGYSFQGTLSLEDKGNSATATAKLLVNNWPANSLFIMGGGSGNSKGGDPGLIADLAQAIVESFLMKKLLPKVQADYDAAVKELNPGK
jgi:hypothetical protein